MYKPDVTIRRLLPAGNPVEGSELQLQCDVDSKPPPQAVGGLRIAALNKSDNGTYRCLARNAVGSSHRDFTLIVH
ncbi:unnamed protein product, partial [Lampetra fluviatilis]